MWLGFDLDSTLAFRTHGEFYNPMKIGEIIPKAKELLLFNINRGKEKNYDVKIFTARACETRTIPVIKQWLKDNGLPDLEITNVKDYECFMIIDDIACQIIPNTGVLYCEHYLKMLKDRDDLFQEVLIQAYSRDGVSLATIEKIKNIIKI